MDIQQQNNHIERSKQTYIDQDLRNSNPKKDLFEELFINEIEINQMAPEETFRQQKYRPHKRQTKCRDFRKILNSSSSNQRLIPSQMKYESSRQNSERERNFFQTQNSLDSQSFRKSFKKRYDQSFSVENTIRDSSSSQSQRSGRSEANILPSVYKQQQNMSVQSDKKMGCNCKRSKCLKLYCQCFQKQLFCNQGCNCHDCGNFQNSTQHKQAIIEALGRNANGFELEENKKEKQDQKTFSLGFQIDEVKKGCKCRKTHCLKKYCECYQNGVGCGPFCKCQDCHNTTIFTRNQSMSHIQMTKYV